MATAGHKLATDATLDTLAKDATLDTLAKDATLDTLAKDTSVLAIGSALTGTGGIKDSLAAIHDDLGSSGTIHGDLEDIHEDLSGQDGVKDMIAAVADAIEALPNATQTAADNANAAAEAANTAVVNLGGLVASPYSSSSTYKEGDYTYNNSHVYRCKADIDTPEEWTSSHWTQVSLGNDVTVLVRAQNKYSIISDGVLGVPFVINKWINTSGAIQTGTGNARMATEKYIPVVPGDQITYRLESGHASVNAISFYDYKKTYVSGVSNAGTDGSTLTVTVPENCVFARFSTKTDVDTLVGFSAGTVIDRLSKAEKSLSRISANDIHFIKNRFIDTAGVVHFTTDGIRYAVVDFVPVSKGAKIAYQLETDHQAVAAVSFYDKDKKLIGIIGNTVKAGTYLETSVPENCCFVRFSTRNDIETYVEISPKFGFENNAAFDNSMDKHIPQSIESLRRNLPMSKGKVQFPSLSFLSGLDLSVYSDGYSYESLVDLTKQKNNSGNSYTVSDTAELSSAISAANAGDTIFVADGVYEITPITKSLNIIAQNKGKALIVKKKIGDAISTSAAGVYKFSVSSEPSAAYYKPEGKAPIKLTKKDTTQGTIAETGTFSYNSSDSMMFVHLPDNAYPTDYNLFVDVSNATTISIRSSATNNIKIYLEGINVWGNGYCLYADSSAGGTVDVIAVDCSFWHSSYLNVVNLLGANGYFQRCEAAYGYRDGFNYHANASNVPSYGLEIDCMGHDNGTEADPQTEESNNGSTNHDGGVSVRINGYYYRNTGGNLAETNSGTKSYNYGCVLFDSRASDNHPTWSGDFWCADSAEQYVYGCKCIGDSTYGLDEIGTGGTIYYDKYTETGETNGNVIEV